MPDTKTPYEEEIPTTGRDIAPAAYGDASDPTSSDGPTPKKKGFGFSSKASLSEGELRSSSQQSINGFSASNKVSKPLYNKTDLANAEGGTGIQALGGATGIKGLGTKLSAFFDKPGRKKKAVIGGGLTAGGITAVIGISSFLSGPMQLVHLSQVLQNNFAGQEESTSSRTGKLFKYWRNGGDVGHTRLGKLGYESKLFKKTMTQLSDIGVEFQSNTNSNLKSATYDTEKLQKKYPELKGMTQEQQRNFLSKKLGIPKESLVKIGSGVDGHRFAINTRDMDLKSMRALGEKSIALLDEGKLQTGMKFRVFSQYFELPSLWHPLERSKAKQSNKLSTWLERRKSAKAAQEAEKERTSKIKPALSEKAVTAHENLKKGMSGITGKSFGATLMVAGTICAVRDVADAVVTVNRAEIVLPSAAQAADKIAIGSQVTSGQDIDIGTLGEVAKSFEDPKTGKTIWQGKALQATANPSKAAGEDLDAKYGQAFSGDTTAQNIKDEINSKGGKALCSPLGKLAQLTGGLLLLVTAIPSGGGSMAVFAGTQAAQTAAFMGVMVLFQQAFSALISNGAILPEVMSGPQGGNLLAYGGREFSNMGARVDGGVALSDEESLAIDLKAEQKNKEEFQQRGFFARVFDPYDYRTPVGQFADSLSPRMNENIGTFAQSIATLGASIPHSFTSLMPRASAAKNTYYDWPFPRYGIPQSVLNDPAFDDPYASADEMAAVLDREDDTAHHLVEKAKKCFGVDVTKDGDSWTVKAAGDVDPNDEEYTGAGCDDLSDTNWKRMMLFVFDTRTMMAISCYDNNDDACTELGVGGTSTAGSSTTSTSDSPLQKLPNPLSTPGGKIDPKGITLHWWGSGSNGQGINALVSALRGNPTCGSSGCSVQIGITADGKAYQMTENLTDLTYHAIGANDTTFGIEIEGGPDEFGKKGIEKYPKKFDAVVATVKYLVQKYDIPTENITVECDNVRGIHPHKAYNHCPGAIYKDDIDDYYFKEVMKRVRE